MLFRSHKFLVKPNILTGGTPSADSIMNENQPASEACDGLIDVADNGWVSSVGSPHWWKYDLGTSVTKKVIKVRFFGYYDGTAYMVKNFSIQGSNDDSNWDTLYTGLATNTIGWQEFSFSNSVAYRYYRIYLPDTYRTDAEVNGFREIEMFEDGIFTPFKPGNVEALVVAGGGGGGGLLVGGGGGAGGLLHEASFAILAQAYPIVIGNGGLGRASYGVNGENSSFDTLVAIGGGYGSKRDWNQVGTGGSGGGEGDGACGRGGYGTSGQGYDGGAAPGGSIAGGGGGGAGEVGGAANGTTRQGGDGGDGLQFSIDGTIKSYAGGGGGSSHGAFGAVATVGGQGGGGAGTADDTNGTSGTANLGGGGGASLLGSGGNGGSGVVVIRYLTADQEARRTVAPMIISFND